MSIFQCEHCGCAENTALTLCWLKGERNCFDWTGMEDRRDKHLCSACSPAKFSDGTTNDEGGAWHDRFDRIFLPKGEFHTNREGNLQHTKTGKTGIREFAIDPPADL